MDSHHNFLPGGPDHCGKNGIARQKEQTDTKRKNYYCLDHVQAPKHLAQPLEPGIIAHHVTVNSEW